MTTVTFRIPDELNEILEELCRQEDRSKSWFMRKALEEKLEDWRDLMVAKKGRKTYESKPDLAISHNQLLKELGIKKKR
jgi:predicted transcriptional regulator